MSGLQEAVTALRKAHAVKLAELEAIEKALAALGESDSRAGEYTGLGIVEAAKRLIREVGEPLDTKTIAEEILRRGVVTKSHRYVPTVYATLENSPEFVRSGKGRRGKWEVRFEAASGS